MTLHFQREMMERIRHKATPENYVYFMADLHDQNGFTESKIFQLSVKLIASFYGIFVKESVMV